MTLMDLLGMLIGGGLAIAGFAVGAGLADRWLTRKRDKP